MPSRHVRRLAVACAISCFTSIAAAGCAARPGSDGSRDCDDMATPLDGSIVPAGNDGSIVPAASDGGGDIVDGGAPPDGASITPLERELAALAARAIGAAPSATDVQQLVAAGIPKPPDPRDVPAHAALMRWSQDALALAMRASVSTDPTVVKTSAAELARRLDAWVAYGTGFGDPSDVANYGNAGLELTWFMGNLARAATLLHRVANGGSPAAAGLWPDATHAAFSRWAHAMQSRYFDFAVFSAGLSNRKASQLETMMRIAELDGAAGETELTSLFGGLEDLLTHAIATGGDIPEDTPRDKYHPQFFLASALQALELEARHGHTLDPARAIDELAVERLAAALRFCAAENQNDLPPPGYPSIGDAHANHDIPFWVLSGPLLAAHGLSSTPAIDEMVARNYDAAAHVDFVMQWGFDAIAHARGF